jgi:ribosomal protein S18 acetylase RimI-like enzyme
VIEIRTATADDDAVLVAIDDSTWNEANSPAPATPGPRSFFDRLPPQDVLVAELDGTVVGYAALSKPSAMPSHAHVALLNGIAVAPEAAGRGVGRRLVEAAVAEATARGARKISLRVLSTNPVARHLYESSGFVVEGVLREELLLGGRYVDDLFMARMLP